MVDGMIQLRVEDAMLALSKVDTIINVIKFVLHVLECDPEECVRKYLRLDYRIPWIRICPPPSLQLTPDMV